MAAEHKKKKHHAGKHAHEVHGAGAHDRHPVPGAGAPPGRHDGGGQAHHQAAVEHSRFDDDFLAEIEAMPEWTYAPSYKTGEVASGSMAGNSKASQPGIVKTGIVAGLFNATGNSRAPVAVERFGERGEPEHFGQWIEEGEHKGLPGVVDITFWG